MSENFQSSWDLLLARYFANNISRDELETLLQMAESGQFPEELTAALKAQWENAGNEAKDDPMHWDNRFSEMMQEAGTIKPGSNPGGAVRKIPVMRMAAAAIFLVILGAALTYFLINDHSPQSSAGLTVQPSAPGQAPTSSKATITLANGQTIYLDSAGNGTIATQGNARVVKTGDGQIAYRGASAEKHDVLQYNTLFNPRGSKVVSLQLSDGTRVWLNSESSLRYPASFAGRERRVVITGEAYFEVASNPAKPFTVSRTNDDAEIRVLGTHFNINAYDDETAMKTTLLEGSVRVQKGGQSSLLKPGQQAQLANGKLTVLNDVDTDAVVAWKNGYFSFAQTDMATLLRQIGRWYDMEIEYAGKVPERRFGGEISRDANVKEVLKILEESKVHFKTAGKKIIVLPEGS